MKSRTLIVVVIAMLGANSASADLSKAAKSGSGTAKLIVALAPLLRIASPQVIREEFGPCEVFDDALLECNGLFFGFNDAGLKMILLGEYESKLDKDFDQREWVAAAAFRLNKETGVNFKDNGENDEGWHELVWRLRDGEFFLRRNKKKGNATIGVQIR